MATVTAADFECSPSTVLKALRREGRRDDWEHHPPSCGNGSAPPTRGRLTLDLDPMVQRRLKAVAAMKGISMRQYCLTAIGRELSKDEVQGVVDLPFGHEALDRLDALRKEIFGDRILPGDSVDLIREARESRSTS